MRTSAISAAVRPVRMAWRRLTSMRTALILLFLLAVAAVPGSLLPQRQLNPSKTSSYIATHGAWGRFLNAIGMFDVFGSAWFAAIYLLLFVSLVGCLVPRIRVHARALARKPLPAPRNLDRLPESARFGADKDPETYARAARHVLGRRWRVTQRREDTGAVTLSAEKGYSRESGNLLFHVALLVALVLIAIGRLYTYEGQRIVVQGAGNGFCDTISQYDSWNPGRFAAEGRVHPAPFCIDQMSQFVATYSATGEPREFRADVTYRDAVDSPPKRTSITVNHPLRLEGDRVYLINHGFAPRVTIRMPDGTVRHDVEPFIASNASTLFSEGAFKQPGPAGKGEDVGISGFFAPSPVLGASGTVSSSSPRVHDPELGMFVYEGDLSANGAQQSVYSLDHSTMHRIGSANLRIGQTKKLPGGVTVRFDGWVPWASLQVSHDPTQGYLLIAAVAMVLGLFGSLAVRRRRVWLRIASPDAVSAGSAASPTVVSVGGLARSDSGNFTAEFAGLLARLEAAGGTPGPTVMDDAPADPVGAGKD